MTNKISLRQPRIIINAVACSLSILAAVVAVRQENSNAKTLSWIVAISSAAIGIANERCSYLYEDDANNQLEAFIQPRDKKIAELTEEVKVKRGIENQLKQQHLVNKELLDTIVKLKSELEFYQNKASNKKAFSDTILDTFLVKIKELLNEHIEENIESLKTSVDKMKRVKDEHIITNLNKIQNEIETRYVTYKACVAEIERNENLDFVIDTIDIINQVHNELASLKVKFVRTLGVSEPLKLQNALSQEKGKSALAQLAETDKASYKDVIAKLEESEQVAANNDQYMQHIIAELEKAIERLAQKDEEIKALKRPQYWPTPTRDDQWISNIIISYFEKQGIILDRAHNDYDKWQATLGFHIDRNRRLITAEDLNKHSEKIEQLAHTLNTPKFKFDGELKLMTVLVQIAKKNTEKKS
ncbi:hypothetical protein BZZ01_23770 [Nostocales cyanobacterium HT-58-2]|nr:hypothetical protein BZZ01_23770 [Nostocales cyanobacterium HT-58-2]